MFTNKVVIITGCCGGIGKATCLKFASMGANVVAVGKKEDERMQKLLLEMEKVKKQNNEVSCFAYD